MDMAEKFRDGGAALHRPGLQSGVWNGAKQINQYRVVSVPRIQQSLKQALVWRRQDILTQFVNPTSARPAERCY
jgi:hypothetical protein